MQAAQTRDPNTGSLPGRVAGMAARFLARRSRSKLLPLDNMPPLVSFSFDDVPASACERGARILEKYGARGTFFVSGGSCGTAATADAPPLASIETLRSIWQNGHEIGCHTYSHAAIRFLDLGELTQELSSNQASLRQIGSNLVLRNFAYPYGDLSIETKRYLETRFDSCRSGHPGINSGVADLGALNAWPLQNASLDFPKIGQLVAAAVRQRGWLIFYSHDVADQPSPYGVSPDLLEWAVGSAKRAGCVIAPIAGCLDIIRHGNGR